MTFLINLLIVLSKTIGWKALRESYDSLLGLEIIMDIETLKYDSQWPNLMHVLEILISFLKYVTFLTHLLTCFQDNLSSPGVNKLLHFVIFITCLLGISSSKSESTWQY